MRKKLEALFPEINLIEKVDLREKTIAVWTEALEVSGWSVEDLEKIPFTLLVPNTEVSLATHVRAVTLCSLRLAEILETNYPNQVRIDRDILVCGALLHDVGKLFEIKRQSGKYLKSREGELLRHPISGAALAARFSLPIEVLHIIAGHSKEGDNWKRTAEAIIIHHADFVNFDVLKA